jgi:chaperonin cofactor prefoldin
MMIKLFEEFKNSIGNKTDIKSKIKNLKKVPKELKEVALSLVKQYNLGKIIYQLDLT